MSVRVARRLLPTLALLALAAAARWAAAQDPQPPAFPAEARRLEGEALDAHVRGRVFEAQAADGRRWRFEFSRLGYLFVNVYPNFADDGPFEVQGSRICVTLKQRGHSCGEYRVGDHALYLKRQNEIVAFRSD
jgi:hypothetical protein